jgi:hypothetical protein
LSRAELIDYFEHMREEVDRSFVKKATAAKRFSKAAGDKKRKISGSNSMAPLRKKR